MQLHRLCNFSSCPWSSDIQDLFQTRLELQGLKMSLDAVTMGFDLQLYAPAEYSFIYWTIHKLATVQSAALRKAIIRQLRALCGIF